MVVLAAVDQPMGVLTASALRQGRTEMTCKPVWPIALLVLFANGEALGQDALGSGRALDANLRAGSGGVNAPVSDFYADLALRNAIVTGNAPGGRHFRAEVGYSAPGDFLGERPGDLVFDFARDSYFSGLAANDVRGISGLQLQMNVSVAGQATPGGLIISRPGAGASADLLNPASAERLIDPFAALQGSLRSTSSYMIRQADRPSVVGQRDLGDGRIMPMAASALVGVRPLPFENVALSGPMDVERMQVSPTDPLSMLRGPQDSALQQARIADGAAPDNPLRDPSTRSLSQHEQLLDALRASPSLVVLRLAPKPADESPASAPADSATEDVETAPDSINDLDAALRRLTESLAASTPGRRADAEIAVPIDAEAEVEAAAPPEFDPMDPTSRRPAPVDPETVEALERGELDPTLTLLVEALAQEEFTLRHFAPEEQTTQDDLFATHMRAGETALREGRWIDAEERFAVALTIRPGDAMAALARVQAQVGAGLLRSAASNLRELMRAYPELAGAKLDTGLMAPKPRLDRIASRLELQRDRKGVAWIDAAFLSAYVARLLNDQIRLVRAFEDLERAQKAAGVTPDPIYAFLERVWVADTYDVTRPKALPTTIEPEAPAPSTGDGGASPR